jgi:putative FmdB family regulatory protein
MPLYEYKCVDCGSIAEFLQKVGDPPIAKCAKCGGRVRKIISSSAIQFKGSGWYITDYTKKNMSNSNPSPPEASEKPEKKPPPKVQKQADKS